MHGTGELIRSASNTLVIHRGPSAHGMKHVLSQRQQFCREKHFLLESMLDQHHCESSNCHRYQEPDRNFASNLVFRMKHLKQSSRRTVEHARPCCSEDAVPILRYPTSKDKHERKTRQLYRRCRRCTRTISCTTLLSEIQK